MCERWDTKGKIDEQVLGKTKYLIGLRIYDSIIFRQIKKILNVIYLIRKSNAILIFCKFNDT